MIHSDIDDKKKEIMMENTLLKEETQINLVENIKEELIDEMLENIKKEEPIKEEIVKIIFICHNQEIVNSILNNPSKNNCFILFVGDNKLDASLSINKRIIVLRDLPMNIENEKVLLTFTAWYAIIKNNLFSNCKYLCILEYDVVLDNNFEHNLTNVCKTQKHDVISFIPINYGFVWDIKEHILKYFLSNKNINLHIPEHWYATTNHCLKYDILASFVDWYYPSCNVITKLDPIKVSWYHERIFSLYILNYKFNITTLNGLSHQFSNSHQTIHHNFFDLSHLLIDLYINNPNCEFLIKMVENYKTFIELLGDNFIPGVGSYLTDGKNNVYDASKYYKQKLLFQTAKNSQEAIILGDYRGHVSFIMFLANPDIKITCIEKSDYKLPNYLSKMNNKMNIINANTDDEKYNILLSLDNKDYDLIHISQLHPERSYIFPYLNWIGEKYNKNIVKVIIDDIEVYTPNLKELFLNNNINCKIIKEEKSNCIYPNLLFEIKKCKKYFLIYNDDTGNYDNDIDRLVESIKKYSDFEVIIFHKKDINSYFVKQNENILKQSRGGGYWLWKPYIINETLLKIEDNDLLFYMDAKYYFKESFKNLYNNKMNSDILIWKNKPNEPYYPLKQWCKMDVIQKYNIYHLTFIDNYEICWAGAMLIRKTNKISLLMKRWLDICCNEQNITDIKSIIPNRKDFKEHRHDQSLLSIVLHEYNIPLHYFEKKYLQNTRIPY